MNTLLLAAVLFLQDAPAKPVAFDYSKVDRKIATSPTFLAEPRFAMLLLGSKTRIWMALDKSTKEVAYHNVLYIDRDADGDLGERGERFNAIPRDGKALAFEVGKIDIAAPENFFLDDLTITSYPAERVPHFRVSFRLNDKVDIYGPYAPGHERAVFEESPAKAPILHADLTSPLNFFHAWPEELPKGQEETFMLYVGQQGSAANTFMAVDENYLKLDQDKIFATIIGQDSKGKEVRRRNRLDEHC